MNRDMERYRQLFLDESLRHLQAVEERMVSEEAVSPQDLDAVFREIHSLKGMAASMGFDAMAELAHRLEDTLDRWRARAEGLSDPERDLCLRVCDRLGEMREDIASGGTGDLDWSDLAGELEGGPDREGTPGNGLRVRIRLADNCASATARAYLILQRFRELDPDLESAPPEEEILAGTVPQSLELVLRGVDRADVEAVYGSLTEVAGLEFPDPGPGAAHGAEGPEEPPPETVHEPRDVGPEEEPPGPRVRLPDTVQVPVEVLDAFVDLLGELTIARSHIEETARRLGSDVLFEQVDRLGRIVRSLHGRVMSLRMLPFGLVVGGLRRLVRDQAARLGKEVEFRVQGEEIGLDKSILLQVSDPLVHLVRNAIDHGIEPPPERQQRGKPVRARIELVAERVRNRVGVRVRDDGRGIDVEAVRRRAVELGFVGEEESRRLSPAEIFAFLFRPGFTTRSDVTELSGRGVGLDAVKARVEAMGGTVELSSSPGEGTEVRLDLPLSVAILPVLLVQVGRHALALPTASIERTVEARSRDVRSTEEGLVLLTERGQVPVLGLGQVVRFRGERRFRRLPLVLTRTGRGVVALGVDRFLREEDLFIKPLRGPLRSLKGVAGYSILGDGRLVFLLDPPTLLPPE